MQKIFTMGDSETVVAQTSAVIGYTSTGHTSMDSGNASLNAAPDGVDTGDSSVGTASGDLAASVSLADASNTMPDDIGDKTVDEMDMNSARQEATENITGLENTSVNSPQVVGYDPSVNGDNASEARNIAVDGINANGSISENVHGSMSVDQPVDGPAALSAEEDRLWSIVRANSLDFNAWTALIEETEKMAEDNILKIRSVYDPFLAEFPLCYGYWKKYADLEARLGSIEKVVEVYERAIQGVTYSVDIWLHYCVFAISTYGDAEIIRSLFERGLAYVGTDYLSFSLWDKYIEYEYSQQDWPRLAMIYTRILESPNQQLDRYFNGFKELVASRHLSELRTAEDAAAAADANSKAGAQEVEGEVHPISVEQSSKSVSAALREAGELEKYITIREEMYTKAKEFDSKIIGFETAIRRPYFHVRPLNVAELENWQNYLDFIEGGGDLNKLNNICRVICYIG